MENENLLPKPEIEIPAHTEQAPASKGETLRSYKKIILLVAVFIIILTGIAFGAYAMSKNSNKPSPSSSTNNTTSLNPTAKINFSNLTFDEFCKVGGCLEDASPEADLAPIKTYEGEDFEFSYPSDWKISKAQSIDSGIGEIILTRQSRPTTEHYDASELKIIYQEQDLPLEDWFKHNFINSVYQTVNKQDLDQSTSATIDGKDAIFLGKLPGVPLYDGDRIAFINGRIGYALSLSGTKADAKSIYTILSSFKFTDTASNSEILAGAVKSLGNKYTDVEINKVYGDYALGAAGFTGTGGGIEFIVHKENGVWTVIWRGNEAPGCSEFAAYPDFPAALNCDPSY